MKDNKTIEELISSASNVTGASVGGITGFLIGGPAGAVIGGAGGALLADALRVVGIEAKQKYISRREEIRIGSVMSYSVLKIQENIKAGKMIRTDDFFDRDTDGRSNAEEVSEGVLIASQREHEERKIKYMGNMLGNIAFDTDINRYYANLLIDQASQLLYRQLCLLKLFAEGGKTLRKNNYRDVSFKKEDSIVPLLYEVFSLDQKQLVVNTNHIIAGITDICPSEFQIQGIGKLLYEVMELNTIPDEDMNDIIEILSK